MAPDRVDRVDPQDELTRRVAASGDRRGDGGAGGLLGLGRDRVFEIENQRIGRQGARLFEGARVRARHKQDAAAGADRRGHRRGFPFGFSGLHPI